MTGDGVLCAQPGCDRLEHTRGYCATHYRYRLHTGRYGYRDATTARRHIDALRRLGWTWQGIADNAGLSTWVAHNVDRGRTRRLLPESEAALLRVPLIEFGSLRGVDHCGSRRRLQALMWLGWSAGDIASRIGYRRSTVYNAATERGGISVRFAQSIAALYEQISHLPGPSKQTATKARRRGYAPPLAWDDEKIDNPRCRPSRIRSDAA